MEAFDKTMVFLGVCLGIFMLAFAVGSLIVAVTIAGQASCS